ncbi:MAG TPA: hypothetical protein VMR49_01565 [Candidatus Paceibacterota bacterium]|nr:hypothetical protein [Candidatus Paceibacterota bacterium]
MINKKYSSLLLITGIVASLALASSAFAQTNSSAASQGNRGFNGKGRIMMNRIPGVFGTVSAVNGTSITVASKIGPKANSTAIPTVYTVDASNAIVTKDNNSSSVSSIAVGDTVMVEGSVTGTSVVAKTIRDGIGTRAGSAMPNSKMIVQGNGEPVIAGNVTAVSGETVTITNKSNVTYTIDATNAKIQKGNATGTIASITVGDNVIAQGTINGTAMTASSIIDQVSAKKESKGFFGAIGSFFSRIFGF